MDGNPKSTSKDQQQKMWGGLKGDLLIQDLGKKGTDIINGMCVVNNAAVSNQSKTPETCPDIAEREKKKKYIHARLNKRQQFTPFVASVDGLLGVEAEATLKRIASHIATKWKKPY